MIEQILPWVGASFLVISIFCMNKAAKDQEKSLEKLKEARRVWDEVHEMLEEIEKHETTPSKAL